MSLFDVISSKEVVNSSTVARSRMTANVTVTVTSTRITNSFSYETLKKAGLGYGDSVEVTYSKDGELFMIQFAANGLKLSHQGDESKQVNASVRLTYKDGVYPDFFEIYHDGVNRKTNKLVLINDENQIEFDKSNRRMVCKLIAKK